MKGRSFRACSGSWPSPLWLSVLVRPLGPARGRGATGSLGRLAVAQAAQRGHDVAALVRDPARANPQQRLTADICGYLPLSFLRRVTGLPARRTPRQVLPDAGEIPVSVFKFLLEHTDP